MDVLICVAVIAAAVVLWCAIDDKRQIPPDDDWPKERWKK